ncbi:hypothetical protein CHLNCDRAFT_143747 [Chlorella variabilis]|uniref:Protein kinase domain-containing protein n=1 Tax=Chlorella variabilis TaxID=554065 RepID=E1ZAC9_CHLVA|nr:hypothetical protein CHLNCDRAFT_143747 [Chlorella variabilis]EFN57037.1 hypothetical protein CHLNCDRAFT_143747 [Chlorella variabilis]|eukprot:XP_005849139.1 hypothetical protein CHLNCDRAFT_143747 [Chlorella variabilis]
MRYGTLCVVDLKRRSFSAEMYALLVNFANLVVQELMTDGLLTPAADVWSFGVICWEMYKWRSGVRAYVGHRMPHVVFLVTSGKGALALPEGAPRGYQALMDACLQRDHQKRPSFEELVSRIDALLAAGEEATMAPPPPPMNMGPCKASAEMAAAAAAMVKN